MSFSASSLTIAETFIPSIRVGFAFVMYCPQSSRIIRGIAALCTRCAQPQPKPFICPLNAALPFFTQTGTFEHPEGLLRAPAQNSNIHHQEAGEHLAHPLSSSSTSAPYALTASMLSEQRVTLAQAGKPIKLPHASPSGSLSTGMHYSAADVTSYRWGDVGT